MYYRNEQDETLVMLTLAGDQNAYEVLVTRYQKAVIAAAISVTKNHFMAEDAAQDAFVTAWMKLNTLQDPQKYARWVCRIAKNCALNMITRYRSFLPLDIVDNLNAFSDSEQNPAEFYAREEDRAEVNKSLDMLPQKVKQIIHLHYFEGLSVSEIADKMCISEGTVKWQLHDGRKRIRKELCAMNEKYSDTLVERVMKKVEELKLWKLKNNKSGFERVYKEVLREVEELPESAEKQHALADVLMRGWWWIPGKKNDALFERIKNAAIEGKNEEVMSFIVSREDSKIYGGARIDFIRDKQIPRLEKAGFVKTLGREWFWLGMSLYKAGRIEEGDAAHEKVKALLGKADAYRALVPLARQMYEELKTRYTECPQTSYWIEGMASEYKIIDGKPRQWSSESFCKGRLGSIDITSRYIFQNASSCDGYFFADVAPGESFVGSDGTRLTYLSDNECVETLAGKFDNCQLWEIRRWTDIQKIICKTYYKEGVGIVRQDHITDGVKECHCLISYEIKGGVGILPLCEGNSWEYAAECPSDVISSKLKFVVPYADDKGFIISLWNDMHRLKYSDSLWSDAVQEMANEYVGTKKDGDYYICDVSSAIERAEQLAKTPMEKAHTKAAASVMRRIMATDNTFNPDHTATGHWNFFEREYIRKAADSLQLTDYNSRWSFEWKWTGTMGAAETPILYNDILGILQDAANCLWSDEWQIGAAPIVEYSKWDRDVKTQITCEDGGTVVTKAGRFENCFKLCFDIEGMTDGVSYRGGKKAYYFADGIGIVRTENVYAGGARTAIYDLTAYEGVGEGFMPVEDGFMRRYDAIGLTDGFSASAIYTYVADEDGDIVVFADRKGIRELPPPITQYSAVQGEIIAEELYMDGDVEGAQVQHGVNNFHLILHLIARPSYNRRNPKRSIEMNGFYMNIIENLGEDGEVPPAWYGVYTWVSIVKAAALFGGGMPECGYEHLDIALNYCEKIKQLKRGALLDTGKETLFGGVKLEWEEGVLHLPDGSKDIVSYDYRMNCNIDNFLYAITAPSGWGWFNSVRNEDRFKEYIERAKKMAEKK